MVETVSNNESSMVPNQLGCPVLTAGKKFAVLCFIGSTQFVLNTFFSQ